MLEVKNLSVIYPDCTKAVSELSLTLAEGERAALIGANGAGKTSLIMALTGVLPSAGEITVSGIRLDRKTLPSVRRQIGVVFQNPDDQLFMPTVYDDVAFGLRNIGIPPAEIVPRVEACLEQLQILHLRDKSPLRLSGGEKRMAALATVLVMQPSIMVFDEPTAFLDPKARRSLIRMLETLPMTCLIATHDLTFAAETCRRSVLLKNGRLFADGRSDQLLYDEKLMDDCGVEAISTARKDAI